MGSDWKDPARPPATPFPPEARWGIGDALASNAIFIVGSTAIFVLAALVQGGIDDALDGPWLPLVLGVPPTLQLIHTYWVSRARGTSLDRDFGFRFLPKDLVVAAALFIIGLVGASVVVLGLETLGAESPQAAVADLAEESEDDGGVTIWIVLLALVATTAVPVIEELVYRGLWWSALLKRGVSEGWTLVITTVIFAAAHLEPGRMPVLLALGLALGWGRMLTSRIGASIIAHALINGLGMIALLSELAS